MIKPGITWLLGIREMVAGNEYVEHAVMDADDGASMCIAACGATTLAPDPDWDDTPELTPRRCQKCEGLLAK